ncbi:pyruvate kinase [Carboxydothermus ferrireducens]|uniref:Pyruvate kinase n=1 Tax=Carboxydothermus ferrireducens DSM 11255 TaxID=1119529 RepID=A0ABX2R7B1_9THEO|nr:pyruvate kinase [Carboxydothermus ferrireducens]NYE57049.1 pyruvate kinase [Carboxydothermus ferrireducens DSM 11255]
MKRTKIVCTIGPASNDVGILKEMIISGMNVARINFAHGSHEEHRERIEKVRRASLEVGIPVAILIDTKGPEIRIGKVENGKIVLKEGDLVVFDPDIAEGQGLRVPVNYPGLARDVNVGGTILLDDGLIELKIEDIQGNKVIARVITGGELSNNKGVNLPGVKVNLPALTEKDRKDIDFGIEIGADFIAHSFVRKAADVLALRRYLEEKGADMEIIAKIENQEGVENIDEIIKVADGIMVARGDLGVEIPTEDVPLVQKEIIEKCNKNGKPVITATQMLDSMIRNKRPTRAEATDVANAIFDGTDAVMLSGETAAGKYPVEAVKTMARIAEKAEEKLLTLRKLNKPTTKSFKTVTDAISHASVTTAEELDAGAIITPTSSGYTARMVSRYRPAVPIIAATPDMKVLKKLTLVWGVFPLLVKTSDSTDEMLSKAIEASLESGLLKPGDLVVLTAGVPVGVKGTTNLLKVHVAGNVLAKGVGIGTRPITGTARVCRTAREAIERIQPGDILVTEATDRDFVSAIEKAAGLVVEAGGLTSHAAIAGLEFGIPVIVGVDGATSIIKDGEKLTLDPQRGLVYHGSAKVL